ncbi:DoxX family protein [Pusillimonas sp.]|uniref:DoxX family protein n=1 Tax=Pusillimonas sp. TaxID=3040095 RepID=UPI0037C5586C
MATSLCDRFCQPINLIRTLCGLFYFPHVYSKIVGFEGTAGFFTAAGLSPGAVFVSVAMAAELLAGIGLTFGILTLYAALISTVIMFVAIYATIVVKGMGWYWAGGGIEYLAFWGLASAVVAWHAWKADR